MTPSATPVEHLSFFDHPAKGEGEKSEMVRQMAMIGNKANTIVKPNVDFSPTMDEQKEQLAAAFRLFGKKCGFAQGTAGHISLRVDGDSMWMNCFGQHYSTIQAKDLVKVGPDGMVAAGGNQAGVNRAGVNIHLNIHHARSDINIVCHMHTKNGVAWSSFARPLDMVNQDACAFVDDTIVVPFNGIVTGAEEGKRIARLLGSVKNSALLANHGILTVGKTVGEACYRFLSLDKVCGLQLAVEAADSTGTKRHHLAEAEARRNAEITNSALFLHLNFDSELEDLRRIEKLEGLEIRY